EAGSAPLRALGISLALGAATAIIAGLLGAVSSYIVVKTKTAGRGLLDMLTVLPNALPGIVVAVGLILAWNQPWLPATPYNTPLILLLAYCCILRSEEHTSELQSRENLVCRLLLEKKKNYNTPAARIGTID